MFKILFPGNGGWHELHGHGCTTLEEAHHYLELMPPTLYLHHEGDEWPAPPEPVEDPRQEKINNLSPETRHKLAARVRQLLGDH